MLQKHVWAKTARLNGWSVWVDVKIPGFHRCIGGTMFAIIFVAAYTLSMGPRWLNWHWICDELWME
jgi:hypothetical protein